MASESEIVALAAEMINIPSPTGQEGPMAEWLTAWLAALDFETRAVCIDPDRMEKEYGDAFFRWSFPYDNRPNILGRYRGCGGGKA